MPDGRSGERDADLEPPLRNLGDRLDAADDLGADEIVGDGRERHFHALLDRDGARTLLDRARLAADVIDGLQTSFHGSHQRSLTGAPPSTSMMRARVDAVVSLGSASRAKKPVALISRSGTGAAVCRKSRTTNTATWSRRDERVLTKLPCRRGGGVTSILPSSRNARATACARVSPASTPPPGKCQPLT